MTEETKQKWGDKPFAFLADRGVLTIKSSSSLPPHGELDMLATVKEKTRAKVELGERKERKGK